MTGRTRTEIAPDPSWAALCRRLHHLTADDEAPPMDRATHLIWLQYRECGTVPPPAELRTLRAWEREATGLIMSVL